MSKGEPGLGACLSVYAALLALLGLTTALAFVDLSRWSFGLSMGLAGAKALLVLLYFMHVRYGSRLSWLFAGAGFYFLGIFLLLTFSDTLNRG